MNALGLPLRVHTPFLVHEVRSSKLDLVCIYYGELIVRTSRLKISRHFAYPRLLALPSSRPRAIFLEVACCCA